MIAHQYYSHMRLCNLIRNAKKNRPFPGSNKGQVSASVFEDTDSDALGESISGDHRWMPNRLDYRSHFTIVHRPEQGQMWRFLENSRTVNCQTRFLCSRVAISESDMTAAWQVFMFAFSSCYSTRVSFWGGWVGLGPPPPSVWE